MQVLKYCFVVWLWSSTAYSAAFPSFQREAAGIYSGHPNHTEPVLGPEGHHFGKRGLGNSTTLRILCIGASIVYGYPSTDGNGFRYALRNKLIWEGNPVNMIGSFSAGQMADNQFEAQGGWIIDVAKANAENDISSQPNLVIIHVGTNDMTGDVDVANAHTRLGSLIDHLFDTIPGVTIIASTLLPNSNAPDNVKIYNANIPEMIKARQKGGRKLVLADMHSSFFSMDDITGDGTHPTDAGFQKMAAVFYQAIVAADAKSWFTAPANTGISDVVSAGTTCDKISGQSIGPYTITDYGTGWPDGDYVHTGVVVDGYLGVGNPAPEGVYWADIDGDGTDDYVYISQNLGQGIGVGLSNGGVIGTYFRSLTGPGLCARRGVRFADMTGDGRADVCCLSENADLWCWTNTPGADPRDPVWVSMGFIKQNTGFSLDQVRLADIDGDGRADYVGITVTDITTTIWGWRNSNVDNSPPSHWIAFLGVAFALPGGLSLSGWKFVDLNGDHRDDLVHVNENGQVTTWINQRGLRHGLGPEWISMGVTHAGATSPVNVTFGKYMGTGRGDYSVVTGNINTGNVWVARTQNMDRGGTAVAGDGTRYCDMTGDGLDDYIWISLMGEIHIYGNVHVWGQWHDYGIVYNFYRTRREVYFADFDNDKKCDILLVDKATGATTMYKNNFANGVFSFTYVGVVNAGASCNAGYGYDLRDLGVRWVDLDGDGRADFICMAQNGAFTGYFNKGINNMIWAGQMKHTEGRERKNLAFADMNGNGHQDLVWVDMVYSAVQLWNNEGVTGQIGDAAAGTSAIRWSFKGEVASGSSGRGSCIQFANINGLGRADYILVYPVTNRAFTMLNVCPDGGIAATEPNLPEVPAMTFPIDAPDPTDYVPYEYDYSNEPIITCDNNYGSLEDVANDADNFDPWCAPIYLARTLRGILSSALSDYNGILNDGYDKKFALYAGQMVSTAWDTLLDWTMNHGNTYFTCVAVEKEECCTGCRIDTGDLAGVGQCKYCSTTVCGTIAQQSDLYKFNWVKHDEYCPPDNSQRGRPDSSLYWTNRNLDNFWDDLNDATGIAKDSVVFGRYLRDTTKLQGCQKFPDCYDEGYYDMGFPMLSSDFGPDDIANPKEVISAALSAVQSIPDQITYTLMMVDNGLYSGNMQDFVDAISIPVLMIQQAVIAMKQVAAIGEEIAKEEAKNFLVMFFTSFLFLIPILGEAVGEIAGLANLGRVIAGLGVAGDEALNIWQTVDDHSNIALSIFEILLGAGAFSDVAKIGAAAKLRKGMSDDQIAKLGDVKTGLDHIGTVTNKNMCKL